MMTMVRAWANKPRHGSGKGSTAHTAVAFVCSVGVAPHHLQQHCLCMLHISYELCLKPFLMMLLSTCVLLQLHRL